MSPVEVEFTGEGTETVVASGTGPFVAGIGYRDQPGVYTYVRYAKALNCASAVDRNSRAGRPTRCGVVAGASTVSTPPAWARLGARA